MLYLIPTPIAEDALHTIPDYVAEIVRSLDVFIVERGKTARHFIKALGPVRPLQEMIFVELADNHDSTDAENVFLEAVRAGKSVGLLSEAGCPGIADPGAAIVALAHRQGVAVKPLTGPSSLLLALMGSGMNGQKFAFHGYLSAKRPELARDLKRLEQAAAQHNQTQLFIETPYRSQQVLETALESLLPDTLFGIGQDLTGKQELMKTRTVREWKKESGLVLGKLPAVFLIGKK